MKPLLFTIASFALLILNYQIASAKVWRVNNTGLPADFTTAQLAHDNANVSAGDTLYIEPSANVYGNLTINKRLTIISTGNFLDVNPNLQYRTDAGTLGWVDILASGTVLHCKTGQVTLESGANNCRIERSYCDNTGTGNQAIEIASSNNVILNNYLDGRLLITGGANNLIKNNIITEYLYHNSANASYIFVNNVLNASSTSSLGTIRNSIFENNIINKNATYTFINSTVRNNISSNSTLPVGNGNLNNVNMSSVFVNPSGANDVSFVLLGGNNPAKASGVNGEDCGAFGGSSPYLLGLQAAIPAIYQLNVPATASGSTMNISFSTRSNN